MEHAALTVVALALVAVAGVALHLRRRLARARAAERAAIERRNRFLATCARELRGPLLAMASDARASGDPTLAERFDELVGLVAELAELPARLEPATLVPVDLAELVREVLESSPFSKRGPSVILKAHPVALTADRARLLGGIRILLLALHHEVPEGATLTVAVGGDGERALLEIDATGAPGTREAVAHDAAWSYGLSAPARVAPPGATLAVRVAAQVARVHGGHISAATRAGGDRFVLELPTSR